MDSDPPHKRALDLLRKRYRLPVSVIVHAIPTSFLSAWEESDGRVSGLVSSEDDARQLLDRCQSVGFSEIGFRYAEFISLRCAGAMNDLVSVVPLTVRILNPPVAKEKLRLLTVLRGYRVILEEALLKVQTDVNLQERCKLAHERERCTCMIEHLLQMKKDALDRLLLLVLVPGASPADVAEGLWILQHHIPSDHSIAVHPDDGTILWPAIQGIQHTIRGRLGNKLPMDDTLENARAHVLGVFGRYHFESKLQNVIENTRAVLQQYMLDPTAKAQVILDINAQLEVLTRLMNKRSLVGCYPMDLPGETMGPDPEGEDDGNGSQNYGEATPYASDGESSGSSNARAESSITPGSIVSTDSEFYDSDILVLESKDDGEGQVAANVAGLAAATLAAQQPKDIVEVIADEEEEVYDEPDIMEVIPDEEEEEEEEEEEVYDEPGAVMKFHEIEGESDDSRAKRFAVYCNSLDYCL